MCACKYVIYRWYMYVCKYVCTYILNIPEFISWKPEECTRKIWGVSDVALWDVRDGTQLLIGKGEGYRSEEEGLAEVVLAMLVQCAKKACTLQTIWGFCLDSEKYSIVKLQVIGNEVVVKQSPPCYHSQSFMNFIPLMELGGRECTALRVYYY
jgi:hypothetical protein